jgi:endonuclease-3
MLREMTLARNAKAAPAKAKAKAAKPKAAKTAPTAKTQGTRKKPVSMTGAQIEEFFARLSAKTPEPVTELDFTNVYTLLVAVALSAQATDVGVNKATGPLFKLVETPEQMVALGEDGLKQHIRTVGLFNTKAKNVIALSQMLIDLHGSQVPREREALEALPGVGRKTANVVLNNYWGEHRHGRGQHSSGCGEGARGAHPRSLEAPRAPLADSAWPLCLQGPQARVYQVRCSRSLPLRCKGGGVGSL